MSRPAIDTTTPALGFTYGDATGETPVATLPGLTITGRASFQRRQPAYNPPPPET